MSANLRQALEKLEKKGGSLDDLPSDSDSPDWKVWSEQLDLPQLELLALKSRKERQRQREQMQPNGKLRCCFCILVLK